MLEEIRNFVPSVHLSPLGVVVVGGCKSQCAQFAVVILAHLAPHIEIAGSDHNVIILEAIPYRVGGVEERRMTRQVNLQEIKLTNLSPSPTRAFGRYHGVMKVAAVAAKERENKESVEANKETLWATKNSTMMSAKSDPYNSDACSDSR
ncbi:hypothetical protein EVAR_73806_1 [Eumeta japonica]|uniref:Uncharacterized protein n=1 Tax=Eumeta variegata TaxID=151549 RepID=A0A4C1T7H7_EUMVA|nr:hypothetical protein EVAR_73806_1 [Eumeta japonica]